MQINRLGCLQWVISRHTARARHVRFTPDSGHSADELALRFVPTTEVATGHARGISVVTGPLKAVSARKVDSLSVGPSVARGGERARQAAA